MLFVQVNQPPATFDEASPLLLRAEAAIHALREAQLACARALHALEESGAWAWAGCSTLGHFAERCALASDESRTLLGLGRVLEELPFVAEKLRTGRLSVAAAAIVGDVLAQPELLRGEDDWIGWAESEPVGSLLRRVRKRREEARAGDQPVVPLSLFVTARARDDFDRARQIAAQKALRPLTSGETFAVVVDHYLDTFDIDRVEPGTRRTPHTALVDGRYVPMAVRREVYERQGHECAVPYCERNLFLELAHVVAHASGGHREADNLLLLCHFHHGLLDDGVLRLVGTVDAPVFLDPQGNDYGKRYDPGVGFSRHPQDAAVGPRLQESSVQGPPVQGPPVHGPPVQGPEPPPCQVEERLPQAAPPTTAPMTATAAPSVVTSMRPTAPPRRTA